MKGNTLTTLTVHRKPFIVGIMGSHRDDSPSLKDAEELGCECALKGYVLLTGGGTGVMEAASRGAHRAGGLVIGILPNDRTHPMDRYPNEFVDIPVYTGMYEARNIINAKTPHVIVALSGSAGTLSEIAVALKSGTPVIGLNAPPVTVDSLSHFQPVTSVADALILIEKIRRSQEGH